MPFVLILVGVVLVVASVRNTTDVLFSQVKGDFTGPNNFTYWLASILIIGAIGYIKPLQPLSRAFLVLVVVVLVLSHGGLFEQLNAQLFSSLGQSSAGSAGVGGAGSIPSGGKP